MGSSIDAPATGTHNCSALPPAADSPLPVDTQTSHSCKTELAGRLGPAPDKTRAPTTQRYKPLAGDRTFKSARFRQRRPRVWQPIRTPARRALMRARLSPISVPTIMSVHGTMACVARIFIPATL